MQVTGSLKGRSSRLIRSVNSLAGAAMFVAPLLALVAIWAIVVPLFDVNPRVFPSVGSIGGAAMESIRDGTLFAHVGSSLVRVGRPSLRFGPPAVRAEGAVGARPLPHPACAPGRCGAWPRRFDRWGVGRARPPHRRPRPAGARQPCAGAWRCHEIATRGVDRCPSFGLGRVLCAGKRARRGRFAAAPAPSRAADPGFEDRGCALVWPLVMAIPRGSRQFWGD